MTLSLLGKSVTLICPTLVPISAFPPTQNSYGAPIKSGIPFSAAKAKIVIILIPKGYIFTSNKNLKVQGLNLKGFLFLVLLH